MSGVSLYLGSKNRFIEISGKLLFMDPNKLWNLGDILHSDNCMEKHAWAIYSKISQYQLLPTLQSL